MLRSTLLHEQKHLSQVAQRNLASKPRSVGLEVNEAEAFREELLAYRRSGLTEAEQKRIAVDYAKTLYRIGEHPKYGDAYLRRILIHENFELLPGQAYAGPQPDWASGWTAK